MKTSRGIASIAVVALAVAGAVGLASSPAVAATAPVIASFTITGGPTLTLIKDDIGVVELNVRITCAVVDGCDSATAVPGLVGFTVVTPGLWPLPKVGDDECAVNIFDHRFTRVSGDNADGSYRVSLPFSSNVSGTIRFERLNIGGTWRDIPLSVQARTITVNGRDPVIVRSNADPGVVRTGTWNGPLTWSHLVATRDSGRARPGAAVWTKGDCDPGSGLGFGPDAITLSSGFTPATTNPFASYVELDQVGYSMQRAYVRSLNIGGVTSNYLIDYSELAPTWQSKPSKTWANIKSSVSSIAVGRTMKLSGSVGGNGSPTRPNTVLVQRWVGGKWTTLGRALLLVNGRWSYVTAPRSLGINQYRVVKPTNACSLGVCYSPNATSGTVRVTVR